MGYTLEKDTITLRIDTPQAASSQRTHICVYWILAGIRRELLEVDLCWECLHCLWVAFVLLVSRRVAKDRQSASAS